MSHAKAAADGPAREPRPAELGLVDGLDLHARYHFDRIGGDFFDAVRVGTRVAFLLSDIAGRRAETDPIAAATQDAFRASAAELFASADVNLMEATEMLVQAINVALIRAAGGLRWAPTMVGCYDLQLGILAYVNAGGQTAVLRDSEGARPLPNVAMPLGLFTHLTFEASMHAFERGARLLVVTKGVSDCKHGKEPFGAARVLEALHTSQEDSAEAVCHTVLKAAAEHEKRRFLGKKMQQEDMTALAMVRLR